MIAAVAVDVSLPHLDRSFDYQVPEALAASIAVGSRVRVTFAGRLVNGFVLALHEDARHATAAVRAVSSIGPVLPEDMARVVHAVAERYASTFADVVRFAVPPRHVRAEAAAHATPPVHVQAPASAATLPVRGWTAFLERSQRGEPIAACIDLPTGIDLEATVAAAVAQLLATSSVVVVVPDARDVVRISAALTAAGIAAIEMRSGDGPSARQRVFTAIARAERVVVVGTRSAAFAPVRGPSACIIVGDGHDGLVEVQTPGWSVREVALLRGRVQGWPVLFLARHRSLEMQAAIEAGEVKALLWPDRRKHSAHVESVPERFDDADPTLRSLRMPPSVFAAVRSALQTGPVLLATAHRGYVTALRCGQCREAARCTSCGGPLALPAAGTAPRCAWCSASAADWRCTWCGSSRVRHQRIGAERTLEEVGRAFPGVPVRLVDADHPLERMTSEPQLLVVTPGMEPAGVAALAVILDADASLARHDLAAAPEALRRWSDVAATVGAGGRVLVVGTASAPAIQALLRADPVGFAEREFALRRASGLPPAVHAAIVTAPLGSTVVDEIREADPDARLLGPVPCDAGARWVVLDPALPTLAAAIRSVLIRRSAAKTLAGITIRVDPLQLPT